MKRLRQSLLALLVGFALFVNVVVSTNPAGGTAVRPIFYLSIAACLVVMMLLLRPRSLTLAVAITAAVLGYGAVRIGTPPPLGVGLVNSLASTLVEVSLLIVLVLSSHRVAKAMRETTSLIAHLTAGGGTEASASDPLSDPRVKREMTRSRRYQRPLAVVLLEPEEKSLRAFWPEILDEARDAFAKRYLTSKMFSHIGRHLRFVDLLFEDVERGRFLLLCPEAQAKDVERQVDRIRRSTLDATGVSLNAGWSSFPDGAVTFEELVRKADEHLATGAHPVLVRAPAVEVLDLEAQPVLVAPKVG